MYERLQKYMASTGIDSRRNCEKLILKGFVKVNNSIITKLGTKIDPNKDTVKVNNKIVKYIEKKKNIYILLNKPRGYLTTLSDPSNRPTILKLIKDIKTRIHPIGRLDFNSEGLLLLTNDGELTYNLTHPSKGVEKTYIAKVKGIPSQEKLRMLSKGATLQYNYKILPCEIRRIEVKNNNAILKIKIKEGKKRQVRRMGEYIDHPVLRLRRIQMGPIYLKELKPGEYRKLNRKEINSLKRI
ncbi:MAG: pseudouridine synthase [Candidatus Caldatribacteriota bacterium]|nr:pseudouridine synthase [Candidatus Caldatribacteriota bacterium]